jgi:hypothetical protein
MSACYKTSDNKFFDCPPRMADGRHFTDYRPNCHVNELLRADNRVSNSFQYRMFLQTNANTIMDKNREIACSKNCCSPCATSKLGVEGFNNGTMLPEKYIQSCNANNCKFILNDPNGVGLGRQSYYTPNEPVAASWPANQTPNRCAAPTDNFNYYGGHVEQETAQRVAVPGAGNMMEGGDPTYAPF